MDFRTGAEILGWVFAAVIMLMFLYFWFKEMQDRRAGRIKTGAWLTKDYDEALREREKAMASIARLTDENSALRAENAALRDERIR